MLDIAVMIEGQNGVTWKHWQRVARLVEDAGYAGLYRSDHFTNANPPDLDSLELWVSLTWLASYTSRIEFGPLVSPVSFRHPTFTARMAAAVDDLSGGRLWLGVGAGWQEREHSNYGFDLLDLDSRFSRFEEGVQVIQGLLRSEQPISFSGKYYRLEDAILLPRPQRPGGPPILIGGNGKLRTLPLAAKYAQAWNAVYLPTVKLNDLNSRLDELLAAEGRSPEDVHRSMMTGLVYAENDSELAEKVKLRSKGKLSAEDLRQRGLIVGTPNEIVNQLGQLAEAGLQRVMLQWLDLENLTGLESFAAKVLPKL
jgi:F420-dependent oxidoreductase-like protein